MSKHPWRAGFRMFNCPPKCPDRKPGCQDKCEQHIREKENWDELRRLESERKYIDNYVATRVTINRDLKAKANKASGSHRSLHTND